MILKKFPYLFLFIFTLVACETEEFDTALFQQNDTQIIDVIEDDSVENSDNINDINLCSPPRSLSNIDITNSSLSITWLADQLNTGDSWDVRYTEIIDNSINENNNDISIIEVDNNFITLSNLNSFTTYQVSIRKNCDSDTYSEWSEDILITTLQ